MNALLKSFVNSSLWALLLERHYLPPLFRLLPKSPSRILEIGCGRGDTTRMLLDRFPLATIVATDYDGLQVALAANRLICKNVSFKQADATALPFDDDAFDLVIECNTFHHVANWNKALRECARVLDAGGTFAVMDEDASLFNPLFRWVDKPESLFSKSEFLFAAEEAGLKLEKDVGARKIFRCTFKKE